MGTDEHIFCKMCGKLLAQKRGGHRKRTYCSEKCKQAHYRKSKAQTGQEETQPFPIQTVTIEKQAQERIAALEEEVRVLQERLASIERLEERYRLDVQVRHFKSWLRRHLQPQDSDFAKRFLADTRLPLHASRSLYEARLRLYKYSDEDIQLFRQAWLSMLFTQS